MKKFIAPVLTVLIVLIGIILGFAKGVNLSDNQMETLKILIIIFSCSVLYCFLVGEISRNNSQMDKLWSILPVVYIWVIAIRGGLSLRLVVMAIIVTLWGIRLTFNFARKGAYSIKFWSGVEDYRWIVLRNKKMFKSKIAWALFDLFFISFYQNFLILSMTLPAIECMDSAIIFSQTHHDNHIQEVFFHTQPLSIAFCQFQTCMTITPPNLLHKDINLAVL